MRFLDELMYWLHCAWLVVWRLRSLGYKQTVIYSLVLLTSLPLVAFMYQFTLHQPDRGKMLAGNAYLMSGLMAVWILGWYAERKAIAHERKLRVVMASQDRLYGVR